MRRNTLIHRIAILLKKEKCAMPIHKIADCLSIDNENISEESIIVTIYKSNLFIKDSDARCPCCGKRVLYVSLSEMGLIELADLERNNQPLLIEEYATFNIKVSKDG